MGWFWGAWGATAPAKPSPHDPAQQSPAPQAAPAYQQEQDASTSPKPTAAPEPETDPAMREFLQEVMGEVTSMRAADAAAARAAAAEQAQSSTSTTSKKLPISPWGSRWASSSVSGQTPAYPSQSTTTSSFSDEASTSTDPDNPASAPRLSPLAESLLPTAMNCETAFNHAFHCRSLGGQFTAVYRYGTVQSCNEQWNDFWFCMRVKGFGEGKVKEDAIRDHYRQKELAKYGPGKPSSEDVWRERRERVNEGEAFAMPVEAPTGDDAEMQRWEMERMERIRKGLKDREGE